MQKFYLFIIATAIVIISELIGAIKIPIGVGSIVLLPLLYAVIIGMILSSPWLRKKWNIISKYMDNKTIAYAGKVLGIVMLPLGVKLGFMVGSRIDEVIQSGPAFLLGQLGHLAPIVFALPIAFFLKMKEEAVGACVSIGREPTLGVMMDYFPSDSKEVLGTMGIYILGIVFGTIIFSVLGSLAPLTGLHPYSLAIGTGVGSASMMTAGVASLTEQLTDPAMQEKILAFGVTANLLSTLTEAYIVTFVTLPLARFFYKKKYKKDLQGKV